MARGGAVILTVVVMLLLVLLVWVIFRAALAGPGGHLGGGASATTASVTTTALDPAAVTRGQEHYAATCAACHGPMGEGVPSLGKDLVHSPFVSGLSDADLVAFIKKGRDPGDPLNTTGIAMLPKGGNPALNDDQLADIVAFMRSIHKDTP